MSLSELRMLIWMISDMVLDLMINEYSRYMEVGFLLLAQASSMINHVAKRFKIKR